MQECRGKCNDTPTTFYGRPVTSSSSSSSDPRALYAIVFIVYDGVPRKPSDCTTAAANVLFSSRWVAAWGLPIVKNDRPRRTRENSKLALNTTKHRRPFVIGTRSKRASCTWYSPGTIPRYRRRRYFVSTLSPPFSNSFACTVRHQSDYDNTFRVRSPRRWGARVFPIRPAAKSDDIGPGYYKGPGLLTRQLVNHPPRVPPINLRNSA